MGENEEKVTSYLRYYHAITVTIIYTNFIDNPGTSKA